LRFAAGCQGLAAGVPEAEPGAFGTPVARCGSRFSANAMPTRDQPAGPADAFRPTATRPGMKPGVCKGVVTAIVGGA
jgi:hypothetical protein